MWKTDTANSAIFENSNITNNYNWIRANQVIFEVYHNLWFLPKAEKNYENITEIM